MLVSAIVWALLVPGADWLARHDVGPARVSLLPAARDAARGRLLTLSAGLLAAGALLFTARSFTLSREGQVTDRYTKAIEQLGSDKLDVRIGGVYALERVARDSAKDHPTVMEVLTAFIREHSREQWPPSDAGSTEQERFTRPDVQAAVTVTGRRDAKRDILPIDLTGADLTRVDLTGANLAGARLTRANLTLVRLTRANLTGAVLFDANLAGARLIDADLTRADLTRADLTRADLMDANLTRAVLIGARLTGARLADAHLHDANLTRANLVDANLTGARLTDAHLHDANLTRAHLMDANLAGARLGRARWPAAEPAPEGWELDDESGLLKRPAGYQR